MKYLCKKDQGVNGLYGEKQEQPKAENIKTESEEEFDDLDDF